MRHPDQKTIPIQPLVLRDFLKNNQYSTISINESFLIQNSFLKRAYSWLTEDKHVSINGLELFPYRYIINGVSHAIETLKYEHRQLVAHKDEYPFYKVVRPDIIEVEKFTENYEKSLVIISDPFSKSGNINNTLYNDVIKTNAKIWLDCAYVGSISSGYISLHNNVETVCFSFSKGFGIQYNRIGVMFSKIPNFVFEKYKEFAYVNCASAKTALMLMNEFSVSDIPQMFKPYQEKICKKLNIQPSNCVWLGTNVFGNKVSLYDYLLDECSHFINESL